MRFSLRLCGNKGEEMDKAQKRLLMTARLCGLQVLGKTTSNGMVAWRAQIAIRDGQAAGGRIIASVVDGGTGGMIRVMADWGEDDQSAVDDLKEAVTAFMISWLGLSGVQLEAWRMRHSHEILGMVCACTEEDGNLHDGAEACAQMMYDCDLMAKEAGTA